MAIPGFITGGDVFTVVNRAQVATEFATPVVDIPMAQYPTETSTPQSNLGVFGKNPGSTSKFAKNIGSRDDDYRDTMARLFIEMPKNSIKRFLDTVSPSTRPLAEVLASATGTGGASGTGFIDFLLTSANENFQEKLQIVDTLTDNYVAFYSGQEPPVFNYTGVLLNTYQDDQRVWMLRLYREVLRGSRLASRNLVVKLRYDSFIVSGYLESLQMRLSGETEHTASEFSFTMRVKRMVVITKALGAPTLAVSNVDTSELAITSQATSAKEARNAMAFSDPTTATDFPATDGPTGIGEEGANIFMRSVLRAAGKTDAQINALQAQAEAQSSTPREEDPRAYTADPQAQVVDKLVANVNGTDLSRTNPTNATQDSLGGATNVYGQERDPGPVSSQAAIDSTATGYSSLKAQLRAIRKKRSRGRPNTVPTYADNEFSIVDASLAQLSR